MVAAEGQHLGAAGQDGARVSGDGRRDGERVVRVDPAVAVVDHGQLVEGIEAQGKAISSPSCTLAARTAAGPRRAPGRKVVARSRGTPETTTSTPVKSRL